MTIRPLLSIAALGFLAATAGASAQNVPLAGAEFDYADICRAFGPGYFKVPGTETCMKISAGVQTDTNAYFDDFGGTRDGVQSGVRTRGRLSASTVTETEFGPLRTHVGVSVKKNSGDPFR